MRHHAKTILLAALVSWKVWFDDGSGLRMFHSATHDWSAVPETAGIQIILVCETPPYRRIVRGADWYWWEPGYGPVSGEQTLPGPFLPKPEGKKGVKKGKNMVDDALFETYRRQAMGDKQCSVP